MTPAQNILKVFISYSHDSEEHKWWVYELSERLRRSGVDARIDQTSTIAGDSISNFMLDEINAVDKVIIVCTERYIEKANQSIGGVGFERMIITAAIASNIETSKFIPVIRCSVAQDNVLPSFMAGRKFVDMRDEELFEEKIDELIRAISNRPVLEKSPLGRFDVPDPLKKKALSIKEKTYSNDPVLINEFALSVIRANDFATWQRVQDLYFQDAGEYSQIFGENHNALNPDDFRQNSLTVLNHFTPFFVFSLTGRYSRIEGFDDQDRWLQFLLAPPIWPNSGWTKVIKLPRSIAFIYHSIHGALCVKTRQIHAALDIMNRQYKINSNSHDFSYICYHGDCMGVGHDAEFDWGFLKNIIQDWDWLHKLFFYSPIDYQSALAGYYLALNIEEYTAQLNDGVNFSFPMIYPHFVNVSNNIADQAIVHLANQKSAFESKFKGSITKKAFAEKWEQWLGVCYKASKDSFFFARDVKYSVYNAVPDALFS